LTETQPAAALICALSGEDNEKGGKAAGQSARACILRKIL
jgi:hypothetical protein